MATATKEKKGTRRARGTGTVFYDEEREVWVGRKIVGRKPDGSPRYVERSHAAQETMLKLLAGAGPPGPDTTVKQYLERWLEEMDCRPNTRAMRATSVTVHLVPTLGGIRLAQLTHKHINEAAKKWADGREPGTVKTIFAHLQTALNVAVRDEVLAANPAARATRPKKGKGKIDPFTAAEMERIIAAAAARDATRPIALLAASGMRVGEALALDVGDFDPRTGRVTIERSQLQNRTSGPPKSCNSARKIRIPLGAARLLAAGAGGRTDGALFLQANKKRVNHWNARKAWVRLCARLGLRFRNLHQLRHSVATIMIDRKASLPNVARHLGDTVETVVRTYLHPTETDPCDNYEEALYGGRKVGAGPARVQKCSIFRRGA